MNEHTVKLRQQASAHDYDSMYEPGGAYDRPYKRSFYFPLYKATLSEAQRLGGAEILEVGCGNGAFAQLVFDHSGFKYVGFDFNETAIARALSRTERPERFFLGDALRPESYWSNYDTIICTEVLEHIEEDLLAISRWRSGSRCVCSVPNFDFDTHVRYFLNEDEVVSRYGKLIDIDHIIRVPKPLFRGRSFNEYFRQLRWSRHDRRKFFAHLGYRSFENLAGWFVFSGHKK